jgi:subtilase family serine protease
VAAIYLDGNLVDSIYINELGAGAVVKKDIPLSLGGLAFKDTYKVKAEADCNFTVFETNEPNNSREISFSVLAPDLVVQGIKWSPEMPVAGAQINLDVTVKNRGDLKAGSANIFYYVDNVFMGKHSIEEIEPGATTTKPFIWIVQKTPFTFTAVIDEANEIKERDKSNNSQTVTLPAPDLLIDSVTWSPENPVEFVPVTFIARIRNRGYAPSGGTFLSCYIDNAAPISLEIGGISPGGTIPVTFTNAFASGEHTVKLITDMNNGIAESDETNNEKTVKLSVLSRPGNTTAPVSSTAVKAETKPSTTVPATTTKPAVTSSTPGQTPPPTTVQSSVGNIKKPSKGQSLLQNRWLIIGVAVVGIGAIGALLLVRRNAKKKK